MNASHVLKAKSTRIQGLIGGASIVDNAVSKQEFPVESCFVVAYVVQ